MSSILGNIRDFFSDLKSRSSTIQYSHLHNLSISGVPLFTYGFIGITTVILASYTILDSGNEGDNDDDDEEESEGESMLDKLPTVEGIKDTLTNISPFSSDSTAETSESDEQTGGKRKHKKNKTHSNKKKNKNSKTQKSKK